MAELNAYITTFNCGRKLINIDYFAANLFNGLKSDLPPDFIVLCLQEIAPIGYSFLGGSLLTPYFAAFSAAVGAASSQNFAGKNVEYVSAITRNVGMMGIMVFARWEVNEKLRWMETAGVGVGVWEMGNKGAVGVRLGLGSSRQEEETVMTFVAAHLAPMEREWKRRNQDWKSICQDLVFERIMKPAKGKGMLNGAPEAEPLLSSDDVAKGSGELGTLFDPPSHLFFAGDLNYRTSDEPPAPDAHKEWPQPTESTDDANHYRNMLPKDQLSRERKKGDTLHLLTEASIDFPPTYKYSSAAQKDVAHSVGTAQHTLADGRVTNTTFVKPASEAEVWLWAQHRVPSWCDRILFLESAQPTVHEYTALPVQPTSDHRPVVLSCSIAAKPVDVSLKSPFEIRKDWRERRAAARRYELIVGLAAYLGLTWEGEALLAGTVVGVIGGYLVLRALLAT